MKNYWPNYFTTLLRQAAAALAVGVFLSIFAVGQNETAPQLKARAIELLRAQKMTEALPLFEKLALMTPDDPDVFLDLGFSLLGRAANTFEPTERREFRVRARKAFMRSRELGNDTPLVLGMIEGLPADGSEAEGFSDNAAANKLMQEGEAAFTTGRLDDALKAYQNAFKIDPQCYHAALFIGDVYKNQDDFANAEIWYQKAIAINPYTETAYRYSATPLMKQNRYSEARDRYVEAFIVEPYSQLALSGIVQWGQTTKTRLGHPKIDLPTYTVGTDGKINSTVNINPLSDDGSIAWTKYAATREAWRKSKFLAAYPKEKVYRHSLAEEADALRSVVAMARSVKPLTMNTQLTTLAKLDQEGLLEAFVLMAVADTGISFDHPAYLRQNREKLRQYVIKYVIEGAK